MTSRRQIQGPLAALTAALVAGLILYLSACTESFSAQHFSFPPGSKPHEKNWELSGVIIMPHDKTQVRIEVVDRADRNWLQDTIDVTTEITRARVEWSRRERFTVLLFESSGDLQTPVLVIVYKLNKDSTAFRRETTDESRHEGKI